MPTHSNKFYLLASYSNLARNCQRNNWGFAVHVLYVCVILHKLSKKSNVKRLPVLCVLAMRVSHARA